ncbi:hypothetical protein [Crossiella cryophila]|uniref:Secreted protein n=1 Tax=Crossiella cryophila TaxID=43355 RepID=A0A7W7CAC6_9PSEU|nr:hypothetical protein [Crossiella cryophila]MBB4676039.1 hypothetical protein [Crossiella cryophila]
MRVRKNLGAAVLAAALLVLTAVSGQAQATPTGAGNGGPVQVAPGTAQFPSDTAAKPEPTIAGPAAALALPRRHITRYGPVTIGPNRWQEPEAYCPDGMLATGGGEYNSNAGSVTLHKSLALDGGRGWKVQVTNLGATEVTLHVYAVCYSGLSNYQHSYAKRLVQPNTFGDVWAGCPNGVALVGGGGSADTYFSRVDANPGDDLRAWRFGILNKDGAARTVQSQAVCANGIQGQTLVKSGHYIMPPWDYYGEASITCPGDSWVVSGGGFAPRVTDSHPQGEGWRIYYHNEPPSRSGAQAFAICGR